MLEPRDETIAAQVQQGDIESFGYLVERYQAKMIRYAKRFLLGYDDAEDLVQDVFIAAYANIQSFDATRSFSPWLYRIAHNIFINAIKQKAKEPLPFFDPDTLFPHPLSKNPADRELKEQELKDALNECLKNLDPKYREPLVLYYFEEMDYQAIADIMRLPTSTVGVRLARGKQAISKLYHKLHPEYE